MVISSPAAQDAASRVGTNGCDTKGHLGTPMHGVLWFGMGRDDTSGGSNGPACDGPAGTLVLGRLHGPRLLDLLHDARYEPAGGNAEPVTE
jgi:hypothetical protein